MNDEAGNFARDDHCIVVGVISQAEIALVKGDWYVGPPHSLVWASDPNVMYPSIVLSFLLLDFWFKGGAPHDREYVVGTRNCVVYGLYFGNIFSFGLLSRWR